MSYLPIPENMRTCPTCNGTGINPVRASLVCPKCNGEKIIPKVVRFG